MIANDENYKSRVGDDINVSFASVVVCFAPFDMSTIN